jgi:CheY-like chemotaxis protein
MSFRALVVDDDPESCASIAALLERGGAKVSDAGSVADAATALEAWQFRIVLMKFDLPGSSAIELTSQLRAAGNRNAKTPVLALCADDSVDQGQLRAAGVNASILIPPTEERLFRAIRAIFLGARTTTETSERVGLIHVIANEKRLEILATVILHQDGISATALSAGLPMTRQAVQVHLAALRKAGLVVSRRRAQETLFKANTTGLKTLSEWLGRLAG